MTASKKTTLRWIEVILILTTVLSGISSYFFWKQNEQTKPRYQLPAADSFRNNPFYADLRLKIGRTESKINRYNEAIKAKETQQIELETSLAEMRQKHAWLSDSGKGAIQPSLVEIINSYRAAMDQSQSRKTEINYLDVQLLDLQKQLFKLNSAVLDSQRVDAARLTTAKKEIAENLRWNIARNSILSVAAILVTLFLFLSWPKGTRLLKWRRAVVSGISVGLLAILFAYEAFGIYGPLIFCLFAVIICILLIVQKQPVQPETQANEQQIQKIR